MRWPIWKRNRHLKPEEVSEYLDGRLSEKDVQRIEAHLEACPGCRHEVESLRQTVLALRRMPLRQPRRSFVFSAPPVAAPGPMRPEPARWGGLGAAVAAVARPRIPAWAFGAMASACAVAFAVVLSMDLTGSFVSAPPLAEQERTYMLKTGSPVPAPEATPTPAPGGTFTEPPRSGIAPEGSGEKSADDEPSLTMGVQVPDGDDASRPDASDMIQGTVETERSTWWVWHLVEGLLGGVALVAGLAVLLRRRIPVLDR